MNGTRPLGLCLLPVWLNSFQASRYQQRQAETPQFCQVQGQIQANYVISYLATMQYKVTDIITYVHCNRAIT